MKFPLLISAVLALLLSACLSDSTGIGCQMPTLVTSTKGDTLTTITGLRYIETKAGTGATAEPCRAVEVKYTGMLTDGTVFDSGTFPFVPGGGQAIAGFEQGVIGMKVGGTRRLIIPPSLGYGNRANGKIPANSTLIFDIELVSVQS